MYFQEGKMVFRHFQPCVWLLSEAVIFPFPIAIVKKKNLSCYQHCVNEERAETKKKSKEGVFTHRDVSLQRSSKE